MAPSSRASKASEALIPVLKQEQTLKASKALLAHIKKAATEQSAGTSKRSLLDDPSEDGLPSSAAETPIWLTLTTKRHIHPSTKLKPEKIVLPHPLRGPSDTDVTICLISADPQRHYKNIVASDTFPAALRPRITRVIDVSHLKAKFKAYEAQRKLASEHAIFLADDRIVNRLPKVLGKTFYKSQAKRPIPVALMKAREKVDGKRVKREKGKKAQDGENDQPNVNARPAEEIAAEIEKAIGAALVTLSPTTNTAVKVGYAGWSAEQIAENVGVVATSLVERFVPQKWKNVRSIFIKGPTTASLPIWQTDELWMDGADVLPEGAEEKKLVVNSGLKGKKQAEKANVGKKRKSLDAEEDVNDAEGGGKLKGRRDERPVKKAKLPESNDDKLDKEIAERKAKLKKQKDKAKKAVDV